jgi:isocitrate/isopropylmalate dehydrogenase
VIDAIKEVTGEGRVLTPDLGGRARTSEVGDEIVAKLRSLSVDL